MKKKKETIEFRYYEIPQNFPLIALLGERWVTRYGADPMHFHNHLEIGFCYYGEGTLFLGKNQYPYKAGSITVIPKNFPHHTVGNEEGINKWEYLFVDIEKFLRELWKDRPVKANGLIERINSRAFLISSKEDPVFASVIRTILEEMRARNEFYKESVQGALASCIFQLARKNPANGIPQTGIIDDRHLQGILLVLDYIGKHYPEPLMVGKLAAISHMSETHFRRIFLEFMNLSPAEYVTLVRIEKACELLAKTDERLETIGNRVGFSSAATFNRNFKKVTGFPPRQWRNQAKSKTENLVNYNISVLKGW